MLNEYNCVCYICEFFYQSYTDNNGSYEVEEIVYIRYIILNRDILWVCQDDHQSINQKEENIRMPKNTQNFYSKNTKKRAIIYVSFVKFLQTKKVGFIFITFTFTTTPILLQETVDDSYSITLVGSKSDVC